MFDDRRLYFSASFPWLPFFLPKLQHDENMSLIFFFFFLNAPKQEGGVSKSSRSRTREEQFFVSFYESGVET